MESRSILHGFKKEVLYRVATCSRVMHGNLKLKGVKLIFRFIPVVFYANEGGWVRQNTTVVGSYLLV